MNFPLYNTLERKVTKTTDIKPNEKKECIEMISRLDDNSKEILIILIYLYYKNNHENNDTEQVMPYDGKYIQKNNTIDIEWNINKFPTRLKRILYEFLKMHINSMKTVKETENIS